MNPPTKSIKIAIPHRLSRQEATQRLQSGFVDFRKQYASNLAQIEDRWTGDHMEFKAMAFGQSITGRIDVRDSSVDVEVDLPWLFAVLAEKVKGQLQQAGQSCSRKSSSGSAPSAVAYRSLHPKTARWMTVNASAICSMHTFVGPPGGLGKGK